MNKNKILKSVIKHVLKEVSNEKNLQNSEVWETINSYKQPDGLGFLIPKNMLYGTPIKYNKQDWMDWYSDFGNARKQFDLILKNKDKTYRSLCCDEQRLFLISEFIKVRDQWIPDNISENKWGFDQGVIDEAVTVLNYYKNRKDWKKETHYDILDVIENYKDNIKQSLDGTDYFFMVMQKWLDSSQSYEGSITFSKNDYQSHLKLRPNYKTVQIGSISVGFWMWGIGKSEFCDTKGQWLSYYKEKGNFVTQLDNGSVYSFKILYDEFYKWAKSYGQLEGQNTSEPLFDYLEKMNKNSTIEFTACHAYNEDGEYAFQGYFSNWNRPDESNLNAGRAFKCSGIRFPKNGEILGLTNVSTVTQEGGLISSEKTEQLGLVEIPLIELTAGDLGQFYKQFVADPSKEMSQLGSTLYNFAISFSEYNKIFSPSTAEITDPRNYENQLEIPIETPLQVYSGGLFNEEDFIGHVKITENTRVFRVPQEGLSQFIPTAKKSKSGKWYIKFTSGNQKFQVFLPPKEWWMDYYDMTYKIENVITNFWNTNEYPIFAWTLCLPTTADISSAISTFGANGWQLKMSSSGGMFFSNKPGQKNYNEEGYFQQQNMQFTYNFLDLKHMDSRSNFGSTMESAWGLVGQVVVGIVIAVWVAPAASAAFLLWAESTAIAQTAIGTLLLNFLSGSGVFVASRIQIFLTVLFELEILGIPMATYYMSRGDDIGVWLSILLCFLPFALETRSWAGFTKRLWEGTAPKTLSQKLLNLGKGALRANMTSKDLIKIIKNLDNREAMIFGEMMRNIPNMAESELKQIIESGARSMADVALENPEALKKIIGTTGQKFLRGGINIAATGGVIFSSIALVQTLSSFWAKKRTLTEKEQKNLEEAIKSSFKFFEDQFGKNVIEKISDDLKLQNKNLKLDVPEVWMEKFLKENYDMFEKMLKEGGWDEIKPAVFNRYKEDAKNKFANQNKLATALTNDLLNFAKQIGTNVQGLKNITYQYIPELVEETETDSYKFNKGIISKKGKTQTNWVEITDETQKIEVFERYFMKKIIELNRAGEFADELLAVRKEIPCLTDDKFIFIGGSDTDEFYLTFIPTGGSYKGVEIYIIENLETDDIENDYRMTYTDPNGWADFLPDEIIKEYGC
jgi:hypothetical protein